MSTSFNFSSREVFSFSWKLNEYIRNLFTFVSVPYNYFKYLREFHDFLKQNPTIPSITLTYEDLHSHPVDNVKRLAKFIGVECTDEQAKHVMETCSFDNMKKAEIELKEKALYDKEEGKSKIFRKGSLLVCFFYILLSYDFKKTLLKNAYVFCHTFVLIILFLSWH